MSQIKSYLILSGCLCCFLRIAVFVMLILDFSLWSAIFRLLLFLDCCLCCPWIAAFDLLLLDAFFCCFLWIAVFLMLILDCCRLECCLQIVCFACGFLRLLPLVCCLRFAAPWLLALACCPAALELLPPIFLWIVAFGCCPWIAGLVLLSLDTRLLPLNCCP